MSLLETN